MLQDIEIENFRCFEKTRISGFTRVNLIGGKNNAGKTALLEALLLEHSPRPRSILQLKEIRRESLEVAKTMPKRAWDNFFFNQNKNNNIKISSKSDDNRTKSILIFSAKSAVEIIQEFSERTQSKSLDKFISKIQSPISILAIHVILNQQEESKYSLVAGAEGTLDINISDEDDVSIILSFRRMSDQNLTESYDKARLNEKDEEILKAVQILDSSIQAIESFSIGEPTLYLKKNGQKRLPLSLFGDAINRVTEIMVSLVNNDNKILLIDEIENGIHYTNQRDFWKILFRLSIELDIQIFATTHSLEMIQAFKDVGLAEYPDIGAYFEMTRTAKTNQIIGIKRDLETLEYALEQERPIRG